MEKSLILKVNGLYLQIDRMSKSEGNYINIWCISDYDTTWLGTIPTHKLRVTSIIESRKAIRVFYTLEV